MVRILSVVLLVFGLSGAAPGAEGTDWYTVLIAGKKAGWLSMRDYVQGGERIFASESKMAVARGQITIEVEIAFDFNETPAGKPLRLRLRQVMGVLPQETLVTFEDDHLQVRNVQGGVTNERRLDPIDGEWMTPGQAADHTVAQIKARTKKFSVVTLDPTIGLRPITIHHELLESDVIIPGISSPTGDPLSGSKWKATIDELRGITTVEYYDGDARMIRSEVGMMGIQTVMLLSDRESVMKDLEAPELMVETFVRPDRPIHDPRNAARAVLELSARKGELPELPSVAGQTVAMKDGALRVTIDANDCQEAPKDDDEDYLATSSTLDHKHPKIRELQKRALEGVGEDRALRAETLRKFVHDYVDEKGLDTAFATAAEVAATRSGDCSEHGVLLAALLRADGTPSRVVTGLMYVDAFLGEQELFGYHMWSQALIDGRWVDYDAVLPVHRTDATHIILSTSALNDDSGFLGELSTLALVIGNLDIRIITVEPRDKPE